MTVSDHVVSFGVGAAGAVAAVAAFVAAGAAGAAGVAGAVGVGVVGVNAVGTFKLSSAIAGTLTSAAAIVFAAYHFSPELPAREDLAPAPATLIENPRP